MSQSPEHLAEKIAEWVQGGSPMDELATRHLSQVIFDRDAEVRAETLAQAADLIENAKCPTEGCACLDDLTPEGRHVIANQVVALSTDPHYRERIELEAQIAEAEWWLLCDYIEEKGDERLAYLKSQRAVLDAPKPLEAKP